VQLLLRRQSADGTVKDLTGLAAWRVDSPGFGAIEAGGYLRPLAAGKVSVKAVFEGQEVTALINVEPRENRSWDFASDVVPILTRLGCNTRKLPCEERTVRTAFIFPFSDTIPMAITRAWSGREASAGLRCSIRRKASP